MTDQQRWDTLGCYGRPDADTPNLDWLGADGTVFEKAYSVCPSCVPARACLMTGQDPWNTGILGMGADQPPLAGLTDTLPGTLRSNGYHTRAVGKLHHTPTRALYGFDHALLDEATREEGRFVSDYSAWFAANRPADVGAYDHGVDVNSWVARPWHLAEYLHPTAWTATESIRALETRDPTRPFFLLSSFHRPHSPYDPPPYYLDEHLRAGVAEPAVGDWAEAHRAPDDATDPNAWHGRRSPAETRRARAAYQGSLSFIDHQIGRILQYLRRHQLLDSTMIIFTSDHGDMLGDHDLWRKTYAYEGSSHIPFIVRPPGGSPHNARSDRPVGLQDVMPTVLAACGVPVPSTVDGASVLPLTASAEVNAWREVLHGEHAGTYHPDLDVQFLTDGNVKYVWYPRTGDEQLFDLRGDPYECVNLAGDRDWTATLEHWRTRLADLLAPRAAGHVGSGRLVSCPDRRPLVSPQAALRRQSAS